MPPSWQQYTISFLLISNGPCAPSADCGSNGPLCAGVTLKMICSSEGSTSYQCSGPSILSSRPLKTGQKLLNHCDETAACRSMVCSTPRLTKFGRRSRLLQNMAKGRERSTGRLCCMRCDSGLSEAGFPDTLFSLYRLTTSRGRPLGSGIGRSHRPTSHQRLQSCSHFMTRGCHAVQWRHRPPSSILSNPTSRLPAISLAGW